MDYIIKTNDLVECIADTLDLISTEFNSHHRRVACISYHIGKAYGLKSHRLESLTIAAAIHDIGALPAKESLGLLEFNEIEGKHAKYGAKLIKAFKPLSHISKMIEYHHTAWDSSSEDENIPLESRILYLADRIAVLIGPEFKLNQVKGILELILGDSGKRFQPELVDTFRVLSEKESFWFDVSDANVSRIFKETLSRNLYLYTEDTLALGKLFSQLIDFRSGFTATHSTGVSAVAALLAELMGFSHTECLMMRLAGNFHDIGKLAVPPELLEKNGKLTSEEYDIIRSHTYITDRLLSGIKDFDTIRIWGAYHHEKLNGNGYPFKLKDYQLPLGSRIMAVADIFTALAEDRPYRKGMKEAEIIKILDALVEDYSIDKRVVEVLLENYNLIDEKRKEEQRIAYEEYSDFYK